MLCNVIRIKEESTKKTSSKSPKKPKETCYSTAKTNVVLQNHNPQWNEDLRLSIVGSGYIVLNVFSQNSFSGDCFLGQAVLNLIDHPELYREQPLVLTVHIKPAVYPVYNVDGKVLVVKETEGDYSFLTKI